MGIIEHNMKITMHFGLAAGAIFVDCERLSKTNEKQGTILYEGRKWFSYDSGPSCLLGVFSKEVKEEALENLINFNILQEAPFNINDHLTKVFIALQYQYAKDKEDVDTRPRYWYSLNPESKWDREGWPDNGAFTRGNCE